VVNPTALARLFTDAGCDGCLVARRLDAPQTVTLRADEPVALTSVFKIAVALAFERQAAQGASDPAARLHLDP
jgi:beta-lactamase class A